METSYISKYLDFARTIVTDNNIVAISNSDYTERNIHLLLEKQNSYNESVNRLVLYINSLLSSSDLDQAQKKELDRLTKTVNSKRKAVMQKNKISFNDIMLHYIAMANDRHISFVIVFKSGEIWNVNFTASLRSDRSDTHANRFNGSKSTQNYLIVGSYDYQDDNSIKEINILKQNSREYGESIKVVCLEEFMDELLYCIYKYKVDAQGDLIRLNPKKDLSVINGKRGLQIENMYACVLNNEVNLHLFKTKTQSIENEQTDGSFLPNHFALIMSKICKDNGIEKSDIKSVDAKCVGTSGEKADILLIISLSDNTIKKYGISIKSSGAEYVSAHEKHAEDFINVLGITDSDVIAGLRQFERKKAKSGIEKQFSEAIVNYFGDDVNRYNLIKWAVAGEETNPLKADYILLHAYDYNSYEALGYGIKIIEADQYIQKVLGCEREGTFGTHLLWTYKNNIQLKVPFLFDD